MTLFENAIFSFLKKSCLFISFYFFNMCDKNNIVYRRNIGFQNLLVKIFNSYFLFFQARAGSLKDVEFEFGRSPAVNPGISERWKMVVIEELCESSHGKFCLRSQKWRQNSKSLQNEYLDGWCHAVVSWSMRIQNGIS